MLSQIQNKILHHFQKNLVETSVGYFQMQETKNEIKLFVPVKMQVAHFLLLIVLVVVSVILLLFVLPGLFVMLVGMEGAQNVILAGLASVFFLFVFGLYDLFTLRIAKIEYVKFQKYLYFRSASGIIATAPARSVKTTMDEEQKILKIDMNDIQADIYLDTFHDETFLQNFLNVLGIHKGAVQKTEKY